MEVIKLKDSDQELLLRLLQFAKEENKNDSIDTLQELLDKGQVDTDKLVSVIRNLSFIVEAHFIEVKDESGEIDYRLDEPWQSREDDLVKLGLSL